MSNLASEGDGKNDVLATNCVFLVHPSSTPSLSHQLSFYKLSHGRIEREQPRDSLRHCRDEQALSSRVAAGRATSGVQPGMVEAIYFPDALSAAVRRTTTSHGDTANQHPQAKKDGHA